MAVYEVRLLKSVRTEDKKWPVYQAGAWHYAYQDRCGFINLRGRNSGWIFSIDAVPGIDFEWEYNVDPRTPEELANARHRPV